MEKEKTRGFKMTTPPVFLRSAQVSIPGKLAAIYTSLKGILFGDDCWKLADLLISSILFIIIHDWSHVANPAVLLWWKNWVINHCQSYHSSANSDFSISGHWRITEAQSSSPSVSLHFKYQHIDSAIMAGLTPVRALPAVFQKEATRIKTALLKSVPESSYLLNNLTEAP